MAVLDAFEAVTYTDRQLHREGLTRDWVREFWIFCTTGGQEALSRGGRGCEPGDFDGSGFPYQRDFLAVSLACQRVVFGDVGDEAMGLPEQPATDVELDGKLGPMTIRRMRTLMDFREESELRYRGFTVAVPEPDVVDYILFGGDRLYVGGNIRVVSPNEDPSVDLALAQTSKHGKVKGSAPWGGRHNVEPSMLGFGHWDVCTSAAKAFKVLVARALGSGGGIDNPSPGGASVLYQWLDPGLRYGYHGGNKANRAAQFSWDLSNAVALKYQDAYVRKVGYERPVLRIDSRGRLGKGKGFLGMYAAQIRTLLYVLKAVSERTGLPLIFPVDADGRPRGRNWKGLWKSGYQGVATHRHLPDTSKWDIRGLEEQIIVLLLTGVLPAGDFPSLVECFKLHDSHWSTFLDTFRATCRWSELGDAL